MHVILPTIWVSRVQGRSECTKSLQAARKVSRCDSICTVDNSSTGQSVSFFCYFPLLSLSCLGRCLGLAESLGSSSSLGYTSGIPPLPQAMAVRDGMKTDASPDANLESETRIQSDSAQRYGVVSVVGVVVSKPDRMRSMVVFEIKQ